METDLDYYTRCMVEALQLARGSTSPNARRHYEQLARTFAMQVHKAENTPALVTPQTLRLQPLKIAA
jgi:hypothetical protein